MRGKVEAGTSGPQAQHRAREPAGECTSEPSPQRSLRGVIPGHRDDEQPASRPASSATPVRSSARTARRRSGEWQRRGCRSRRQYAARGGRRNRARVPISPSPRAGGRDQDAPGTAIRPRRWRRRQAHRATRCRRVLRANRPGGRQDRASRTSPASRIATRHPQAWRRECRNAGRSPRRGGRPRSPATCAQGRRPRNGRSGRCRESLASADDQCPPRAADDLAPGVQAKRNDRQAFDALALQRPGTAQAEGAIGRHQ